MVWETGDPLEDEYNWLFAANYVYCELDKEAGLDKTAQILDSFMWSSCWEYLQRLCKLLEGVSFETIDLTIQLAVLVSLRACRGHLKGCYEILYRHLETQLILTGNPEKEAILKGLK